MADISRSLEGRAAGVSVQNVSGTFGTAPKIPRARRHLHLRQQQAAVGGGRRHHGRRRRTPTTSNCFTILKDGSADPSTAHGPWHRQGILLCLAERHEKTRDGTSRGRVNRYTANLNTTFNLSSTSRSTSSPTPPTASNALRYGRTDIDISTGEVSRSSTSTPIRSPSTRRARAQAERILHAATTPTSTSSTNWTTTTWS